MSIVSEIARTIHGIRRVVDCDVERLCFEVSEAEWREIMDLVQAPPEMAQQDVMTVMGIRVRKVKPLTTNDRTGQQPTQLLAKHQPCGCIVCTCADDVRCHGCGARHCGTHPVGQIPNAVYEQPGSGGVRPVRGRIFAGCDTYIGESDDLWYSAEAYRRLQSELTAAQQRIAHLEARLAGERASSECGQMALEMLKGRIATLESENARKAT